ncbi:MAG TPA: hypothetical protein VHA52_00620 [Candidatus Babeliaceae bacterium]|nr:hypothetical protein [Candidatus Babeliaceae bacterium]
MKRLLFLAFLSMSLSCLEAIVVQGKSTPRYSDVEILRGQYEEAAPRSSIGWGLGPVIIKGGPEIKGWGGTEETEEGQD